MDKTTVPVFSYSAEDLANAAVPWPHFDKGAHISKFDQLLQAGWADAVQKGCLRYTIDDMPHKVLPGKQRYIVQCNTKRSTERRTPESIGSMQLDFNPNKFHFGKVKREEVVCALRPQKHELEEATGQHLVIVNVSPLEYGHMLLVPNVDAQLPQRLTLQAVQLGIECLLLSSHPGFRVAFNSLCALASVNHLHLHSWYLNHSLRIEDAPVQELCCGCYEVLDMPSQAFAFQLANNTIASLAKQIYSVAQYFQQGNIAHNLVMTRGTVFGQETDRTVRVYIWPRRTVVGQKNEVLNPFNVACAELGGHIPIYLEDYYELVTEDMISQRIRDAMLPPDVFSSIREDVKQLFKSQISTPT